MSTEDTRKKTEPLEWWAIGAVAIAAVTVLLAILQLGVSWVLASGFAAVVAAVLSTKER